MTRRAFLCSSSIATLATTLSGCLVDSSDETQKADIILEGNEEEIAKTISRQFTALSQLVEGEKDTLSISYPTLAGGRKIITMSSTNGVVNLKDGQRTLDFSWSWDGVFPALRIGGKEYQLKIPSTATAMKIAVGALVIWLGAEIGGAILSAIALLAFMTLVLAGLVVLGGVIKEALEGAGLNLGGIKALFEESLDKLTELLQEAVATS